MVLKQAQSGFTLLELLLVVVLLLLFVGVAVTSLAPLRRGARLREGVGQLESLLRFARAEASQQGRRVQVRLGGEAASSNAPAIEVSWEPQPLAQPGVFVADNTTAQLAQSVNDLVRIENVRHLDPANAAPPTNAAPAETQGDSNPEPTLGELDPTDSATWPPIMFYPDGSSDSAEILVASQGASDPRQMLVRWDGLSGSATDDEILPADNNGKPGTAQPLEPASVARSAMGQGAP